MKKLRKWALLMSGSVSLALVAAGVTPAFGACQDYQTTCQFQVADPQWIYVCCYDSGLDCFNVYSRRVACLTPPEQPYVPGTQYQHQRVYFSDCLQQAPGCT